MNPDELLPCPFCGGRAILEDASNWLGDPRWEPVCDTENCVATGSSYPSQAQAIAAWNTRATEPAQVGDADRAFELWFFRDIVDDQRSKLIALMLGGAVAKEATNHGTQRLCLKYILKALRAQGRTEAEREIVAWLRTEPSVLFRHGPAIAPGAHCRDIADAIERGDHRKEGA